MPPLDKITHTLAGAAIAAALLPWGVILLAFWSASDDAAKGDY